MYAETQLFCNRRNPFVSKSNQPLNIHIGNFLFDPTRKIYLRSKKNYGIITVLARSRQGKTAMLKNTAFTLWYEGRKIIVFDPFGEWATVSQYNFDVDFPDKVIDLCLIENFAFKISEMRNPFYWAQLGFTGKAINYLLMISERVDLHNDEPEKFFEIIQDLPANPGDIRLWNAKYPSMPLEASLHEATRKSIIENTHFIKRFFFNPVNDERVNIEDWEEKIQNSQFIVINFGVTEDTQKVREQTNLMCAIVMDKIGYHQIEKYHPCIFFEEVDYFAPNENQMPFSYSREKIDEFNRKKLRKGVFLFYINQVHDTIARTIVRDKFQLILGAIAKTDSIWNELGKNYYNILQKQRVFLYKTEEGQEYLMTTINCKVGC